MRIIRNQKNIQNQTNKDEQIIEEKLTFNEIMKNDVENVFLNLYDFAEEVNINGKTIKAVFTPTELSELTFTDMRLPQMDLRTFICNKNELNVKGLSKIRLNDKSYNIEDIKEVGYTYKITIKSIQ